jgi:tetraacyldisaccharide 4'-kinase
LLVDPALHGAALCGDEPLLLRQVAPVVVARDRAAGAAAAVMAGGEVIVMDDGMQNPSLRKDVVIAVVDGGFGVGNGYCLPAGPLRAPLAAQMDHASAVVIVGSGADEVARAADDARKPLWRARLEPRAEDVENLRGGRLFAFAGIGRPGKFFETLRSAGLDVVRTASFADHHAYSSKEADALLAEARQGGLIPVTTAKDVVRWPGPRGEIAVLSVAMRLEPGDERSLDALLSGRIRRPPSRPSGA